MCVRQAPVFNWRIQLRSEMTLSEVVGCNDNLFQASELEEQRYKKELGRFKEEESFKLVACCGRTTLTTVMLKA